MDYHHTIANELRHERMKDPDESMAFGELLYREVTKVSSEDRTAIDEEIHGARCMAVKETPGLIRRALIEFQNELDRMPSDQKQTYEECCVRTMLYVDEEASCYALHDNEFRLRFLRAELFDPAKAALRFAKYLDFVKIHWGTDIVLKRFIRMSDFNKSETKLFRKGYFQVLPFRDRSGRRVVTFLGGFGPETDPVTRSKVIFYLVDALSRTDIESQQKGFILVTEAFCWCENTTSNEKRTNLSLSFPHPQESPFYVKLLLESVPCRIIAIHNCWPDRPSFRLIAKILTLCVAIPTQRLRLKFHIGDEMEMRYRLKSYGIPIELLPITETGSIKMVNHTHWIKTRRHIEQGIDTVAVIVECPGVNDVVFRQGTSSMENPGNAQCRDLILALLEQKDGVIPTPMINPPAASAAATGNANQQNLIVDRLLEIITDGYHGRFLEWDKDRSAWVQIVERCKIRQKASVLLYSIAKRYGRRGAPNKNGNHYSYTLRSDSVPSFSPALLRQDLQTMDIKSDDDESDDLTVLNNTLGPFCFVERGRRAIEKQVCCPKSEELQPSHFSASQDRRKRSRNL